MSNLTVVNEEKTEFLPLPRDVYDDCELLSIEEKAGQYGPYWSWKFDVHDAPEVGTWNTWQWYSTNNNVHPTGGGAKSPRIPTAILMNRELEEDEFLTPDEYLGLIGMKCRLSIDIEPDKKTGKPRNVIAQILPLKRLKMHNPPPGQLPKPQVKVASLEQELAGMDPDDIAF